ncbi:unnamed protein product [Trichobilharzia regenti]|nr:unnamed protein product [Trichobilharzia regenti]
MQVECLLQVQLPWNVGVIAEQAKRLEQDALDVSLITVCLNIFHISFF